MGNHDVSTANRPIVEDTPDNRLRFAGQLDFDLNVWLPDVLASARHGTIRVAHEGERAIMRRRNLSPAFTEGPKILAAVAQNYGHLPGKVMGELIRSLIEVVSVPYSLEHDGFKALQRDMTAWQYALQTEAVRHGCVAGSFGTVPWDARYFQENTLDAMIDVVRYHTYRERMNGWLVKLDDGTEFGTTLGFPDIMGMGPLTSFQFSFDVPPDRLDDFYNAANIAAALLRAWFPNGDTPYGIGVEAHDMRIEALQEATCVEGIQRTFIGPRWATTPRDVFDMLVEHTKGHSIFLDADENVPGSALGQLLSSLFSITRPRFGQRGQLVNPYFEFRPLSGGPTTAHEISATAVGVGLIYYLAKHIEDWKKFGFHRIKKNFRDSSEGLETELFWVHNGREFTDSARNIAREMLPHIKWALIELCRAKESDVNEALEAARRVVATGITPTVWGKAVRESLRDQGCTPAQAMETYTRMILEISQHGTSRALVGNWRNPVPLLLKSA